MLFSSTEKDVADLVDVTRSTGNRLLFDLNLQLRFGDQWDPSNAIELFQFCEQRGFGENIDWELGNGINTVWAVLRFWLLQFPSGPFSKMQ